MEVMVEGCGGGDGGWEMEVMVEGSGGGDGGGDSGGNGKGHW